MLNPDDLVSAWVEKLRGIEALTAALGEGGSIDGYGDVYPGETNLRRAILQRPAGSILVVWLGFGPRTLNRAVYFQHRFLLIVRAPQSDDASSTYGALVALIVNGIDPVTGQKLLHSEIHPSCYPMDLDLPSAQRQTLLVSQDGETLDYFEFTAALTEIGDN